MRYRSPILIISAVLAILLGMDTLAWWRAEARLNTILTQTLDTADTDGWSIQYGARFRGGWPFGATLALSEPRIVRASQDPTSLQTGWAAHGLTLGGWWPAWIGGSLPMTLSGPQALRTVDGTTVVTLTAPTLHLVLTRGRTLILTGPSLHLDLASRTTAHGMIDLNAPDIRATFNPAAGPNATRLGLRVHARSLTISPSRPSLQTTLRRIDIAAALTGPVRPASPWSSRGYARLLLQRAAGQIHNSGHDIGLDLSASLSLPNLDGEATVRLLHWREAAAMLLSLPQTRRNLPPEIGRQIDRYINRQASQTPDVLSLTFTLSGAD